MIYKLTTMSKQEILIESKEDLYKLLAEANKGARLILTKHGVVNTTSIDSIVPWTEKNRLVEAKMREKKEKDGNLVLSYTPQEALREVAGTQYQFMKGPEDKLKLKSKDG